MDNPSSHRFQVDLRGLIELLSRNLYSGPAVFVREMLQNGVDAIAARRQIDPAYSGTIRIELIESEEGPATLLFQDDGVGLTEDQIHEFLATIGQSSKRTDLLDRPSDFLGQFGIGLLSCFMVTDEIVVITRSADGSDHPSVEWRGSAQGTYSVRTLDEPLAVGTQVYLRAKPGVNEFFDGERILALARDYGGCLTSEITFTGGGQTHRVNVTAPWTEDPSGDLGRERLLEYGKQTFGRDFLDVLPLQSTAGDVEGLAFVLAEPVHSGSNQAHRVYLKNMLLSTRGHDILPDWAFFVQCTINAGTLSPTASRESFYDDARLEKARQELGQCLRRYLVALANEQPRRFQQLLAIHHLAVKGLAVDDDECLELFAEWLPFETTAGTMTLREFRQDNPVVRYVSSRDQFRQIAQVAASESIAVINAGYVYDVEILQRIGSLRQDIQVERFEVESLSDRFEQLSPAERDASVDFERLCDAALQRYKCVVEVSKFRPAELPALYITDANADFLRSVEQAQDVSDALWSGVLSQISEDVAASYARLHLNYRNPVVRRISELAEPEAQRRCIEMLYVQALLLGHFPLKQNEVRLLNEGLLGLLDWALKLSGD